MESRQERREGARRVIRIIEAMREGASTPEEIEQKLFEKEHKMGEEAEKRAMDAVKELSIVREVRKATAEEDQEQKTDMTIYFKDDRIHQPVGLQVKSSKAGLQNFFKTLKPGQRIIGINAGLGISNRYIQESFLVQLRALDSPRQRG